MVKSSLEDLTVMRLDRDGTAFISFGDGRAFQFAIGNSVFGPSSAINSTMYLATTSQMLLQTTRQDIAVINLPSP